MSMIPGVFFHGAARGCGLALIGSLLALVPVATSTAGADPVEQRGSAAYAGPLVFPLRYPPGARGFALAPEGYTRLANGHYRANSLSNRFRLFLPPIGNYFTVRCRIASGAAGAFGEAWWQFAAMGAGGPGSGAIGGGIGIDIPIGGGTLKFTVDVRRHGGPGPDNMESVWIVAPVGTQFESCEVEPHRSNPRERIAH